MSNIIKNFLIFFIYLTFVEFVFPLDLHAQKEKVDSLLKVLHASKEDTSALGILDKLCEQFSSFHNYKDLKKYSYNELTLSEKVLSENNSDLFTCKKYKANALNYIGLCYMNETNYSEALKECQACLKVEEEIGDKLGLSKTLNTMSMIYEAMGNYPEELKNVLAALKIREEISDKQGIANSYNNMGNVYLYLNNYPEALKSYFTSLKINEETGNKHVIAILNNNIGNVYSSQGNYSASLKYYLAALKMLQNQGDNETLAGLYNNIGIIYTKQGNFSEAIRNLLAGLKLRKESGDKNGQADSYNNIGDAYAAMGKYPEALSWLEKGLNAAKITNDKETIKSSYSSLTEVYKKLNDFKNAFIYNNLYAAMKDTLLNESNNKQIAEMKTKYETEKKDKEIQLMSKDKEILSEKIDRQKTTIRYILIGVALLCIFIFISYRLNSQKKKATFMQQVAETKMKALRAQMNPHFIYNSINSVYRYIQENDMKSAETYLLSFSKLIRQVLENSMQNEVSLNEELRSLELYLALEAQRMNNKFSYKISVADDIDRENTLVPPLLMEPFVENSIWHGLRNKEGQGKITINVVREGEMIKYIIEDNGVGRQHKEIKTIVEKGKKQSLGMSLTEERIATMNQATDLKATVNIIDLFDEMKKPVGVKVELSLPLLLND